MQSLAIVLQLSLEPQELLSGGTNLHSMLTNMEGNTLYLVITPFWPISHILKIFAPLILTQLKIPLAVLFLVLKEAFLSEEILIKSFL